MPKLQNGNSVRKISLSQIIENGNVRKDYHEIEELAHSIKTNGLLQPIAVKSIGKNDDGIEQYELIAGHRRTKAFRQLFDAGDGGFSMIEAVVVTGDKLTLQLVENLQRSDLTAQERELGIYQMTKNGTVAQREIAALLGKTESYVSNNLRAYQIRDIAAASQIDTSRISTGALCEIAAAAKNDVPELIKRLADEGGSVQDARKIGREYRAETTQNETESELPEYTAEDERAIEPEFYPSAQKALDDPSKKEPNDVVLGNKTPPYKESGSRLPPSERIPIEFDPPHRDVDINDVLIIIKEYIDMAETRFAPTEAKTKQDAAWDILALLHERL
jgi:ParB family chromosome partitioning protein